MKNEEIKQSEQCNNENFIEREDGSKLMELSDSRAFHCYVGYTDCNTKQRIIIGLNKGETFYYWDWDGKKCVRKTYVCK